jgi:SpoVK/Ycf46/Vps4 family AAA+-type ATPase
MGIVTDWSLALVSLDVSKLREIVWAPDPLGRLVFDEKKKDLMSSFAQHHAKEMTSSSDFIASKGSGLVILLSGPPGTGKTLTAEAIAEETRLPLYRILAGDLGSSPNAIESKLTEVLDIALQWQCVVLLDEADTFINQRKSRDRVANEIVSIFLRQLEYFRGIIFLTTNLPHDIDDAFRSRCRLHIPYPALESSSRREVWRINFEKKKGILHTADSPESMNIEIDESTKLVLSPEEWDRLVRWELSGRDIHNVVENVVLWCASRGMDVSLTELEQTIELTVPYAKRGTEPESEGEEDKGPRERGRKRPRLTVASS